MIVERSRPGAFCGTALAWRAEDGTETPITEVYVGPEEHSCPWAVRRWKTRSGCPDTDSEREYDSLTVCVSAGLGRTWRERLRESLGACVASRW